MNNLYSRLATSSRGEKLRERWKYKRERMQCRKVGCTRRGGNARLEEVHERRKHKRGRKQCKSAES